MPTMNDGKSRFGKAVLVAPLGVPLSMILVVAWESVALQGLAGLQVLPLAVLFMFVFGLPISYGAMVVLGLPYLLWLRSRAWLTWISVCAGTAVIGSIIWTVVWHLGFQSQPLVYTIPLGALIGLVVGVLFSLAAELPVA